VYFRSESQLLLFIRVLYDHLPRHLVFLPVTEDRLSRSFQLAIKSMCRELTAFRVPDADKLSTAQLEANTDSHVLKLLDAL